MKTAYLTISLATVLSASTGLPATAQPPKAMASVEGHVLCSDGGTPAREAHVRLRPIAQFLLDKDPNRDKSRYSPDADTDFNGYYRIAAVRPGTYIVSVHKEGYNDNLSVADSVLDHFTADEQKVILSTFPQITVAGAGAMQQDVVIHRAGAISGRITIDSGGVLSKTAVSANLISTTLFGDTADKDRQHYAPNYGDFVSSDDRGVYRIAGLPPGKYRIQVQVTEHFAKEEQTGHAGLYVYAPEALKESDGALIEVGEGDELSDIDINIPTRLLHSISGTVIQGGAPIEGAAIRLHRQGDKEPCNCGAVSLIDGSYRIDLLPSSTWTLEIADPYRHIQGKIDHPKTRKITVLLGESDALGVNVDLSSPTPKQ